jgi:hypothetical protein
LVNGSNDIVVATVNSYFLHQNLPSAELILFADSNHGAHFQFTEPFSRYVTDFIDRLAARTARRSRAGPGGQSPKTNRTLPRRR